MFLCSFTTLWLYKLSQIKFNINAFSLFVIELMLDCCCCWELELDDDELAFCLFKPFWWRIRNTDTLYFDSNSTTSDWETCTSVIKPYLKYKVFIYSEFVIYVAIKNWVGCLNIYIYLLHTNYDWTYIGIRVAYSR